MLKISDEIITVCEEAYTRFVGNGVYIGLFFLAILYLFVNMKKEDKKESKIKIVFGVYSILILIINLNHFWTKFLTTLLKETVTYWRVYWLLPVGILCAFLFTEIIYKKENKKEKIFLTIMSICVIILSGKYMYSPNEIEKFTKADNYYKVPKNILETINFVSNDEGEYKKIAGIELFIIYTRQIDGKILLSEERSVTSNYSEYSIIEIIKSFNYKEMCNYCKNNKCNYLVLNKDMEMPEEYMFEYNIKKAFENEEYCVYKFNSIVENN